MRAVAGVYKIQSFRVLGVMFGEYGSFCDQMWGDWLAGRIPASVFSEGRFNLESAPEPWLEFKSGKEPLVAVTTNPGCSMEFQSRNAITSGLSPIRPIPLYRDATEGLGKYYEAIISRGHAAHRRIKSLLKLAENADYDGLLQVEAFPFHSPSLPDKNKLLHALESRSNDYLFNYTEHLRAFLKTQHVVGISAVASAVSLTAIGAQGAINRSIWLQWFSGLLGINPGNASHVELIRKNSKNKSVVTAAALLEEVDGKIKVIVLMMGGNHLPSKGGLDLLADAIRVKGEQSLHGVVGGNKSTTR